MFFILLQADLVANVAKLVDEGKITGVSDIRDESDRSGMRVVIEMKKGLLTTQDWRTSYGV